MKSIRGIVGEKVGHATVTDSKRAVIREGAPAAKPKRADKPGTELTIVLPLPSRTLSPNGSHGSHWTKSKAVKKARELAYFETYAAMRAKRIAGGWERAEACELFVWPTNRRRDVRNAESSLKPTWDGIVEAGLIVDDRAEVLTHLPSVFGYDPLRPRVEITVRKLS